MKRTYLIGSVALAIVILLALLGVLAGTGVIGMSVEKLVFSSGSKSLEMYTGETLTCDEWKMEEGTLHEGHTAKVTFQGAQTDAGSSENIFTVTIYDENGANVSEDYDIVCQPGTLTVPPRPLNLTVDSDSKSYDGTALKCLSWQNTGLPVLDNHAMEVNVLGERTEVGQSENVLTARVFDRETGREVTANYTLLVTPGDLTVTPHSVTLVSDNAVGVYNGEYYTCSEEDVHLSAGEVLADLGHQLVIFPTGKQKEAGSVENTFAVEIQDENGINVTHNYAITTVFGTLEVQPRPVTLKSGDLNKPLYDGIAIENPEVVVHTGSLVEGHSYDTVVTGTQTEAGNSPNHFNYVIKDADGNDVTHNYAVTPLYGNLNVGYRTMTIKSESETQPYYKTMGAPLTNPNWTWKVSEDSISVAPGQELKVTVTGSRTEVGESDNTIAEALVFDEDGNNVTHNYKFNLVPGKLVITDQMAEKRPLAVYAGSDADHNPSKQIYNGLEFTDPGYTCTNPGENVGLKKGHTLEATIVGSRTNAGEEDNVVARVIIKDENGTVLFDNDKNHPIDKDVYDVATYDNKLIVDPRPVYVIIDEAEKIYDGTYNLPNTISWQLDTNFVGEAGLLEGHEIKSATVICSNPNANVDGFGDPLPNENGDVWNTILDPKSILIESADGENVTANYKLDEEFGKLTIHQREVYLTVNDATKTYDGTDRVLNVLITEDMIQPENGGFLDGHTWEAEAGGTIINVGTGKTQVRAGTLKVMDGGTDVSRNYYCTETKGDLTINKRPIVITAPSITKVYDGKMEVNAPVTIDPPTQDSGLVEGHSVEAIVDGSSKVVCIDGTTTIRDGSLKILDGEGEPVTDNYDPRIYDGTLIVTQRPITFTAGTAEKEYDGTPLTTHEMKWTPEMPYGGLVNGHKVDGNYVITGSQTVVGSSPSKVDPASIVIYDENNVNVTSYYDFTSPGNLVDGTLTVTERKTDPEYDENTVVAEIVADHTGLIYLRQNSFGYYNGSDFEPATAYDGLLDGEMGMNYLTGIALENSGYVLHTVDIYPYIVDLTGYLIPDIAAVEGSAVLQGNDIMMEGLPTSMYTQGYYLFAPGNIDAFLNNAAHIALPSEYEEAELAYREFVYDEKNQQYTYVPTLTASTVDAVIAAQNFKADDPEIISKVAEYVKNLLTYDLNYDENLDNEQDIAVAVLKGEYKKGVCRHYAIAATMLYRGLGIPARYTVGFASNAEANVKKNVLLKQAHAWVEIYYDGIGWIPVDVTGYAPEEDPEIIPTNALEMYPETLRMQYTDGTETLRPRDRDSTGYGTKLEGNDAFKKLLRKGYTYEVSYTGERTEVGYGTSYVVEGSFRLYDPTMKDVTSEFPVKFLPGKLHVYYEKIELSSFTDRIVYDRGEVLTGGTLEDGGVVVDSGHVVTEINGNPVTHTLTVVNNAKIESEIAVIGNVFTPYVYDQNGEDVSDMYWLDCTFGTLEIYGTRLELKAGDAEVTIDQLAGGKLTCKDYEILSGQLREGHEIKVTTAGSLDRIGTTYNEIIEVIIYEADDPTMTDISEEYYDIILRDGTLSVTKSQTP